MENGRPHHVCKEYVNKEASVSLVYNIFLIFLENVMSMAVSSELLTLVGEERNRSAGFISKIFLKTDNRNK